MRRPWVLGMALLAVACTVTQAKRFVPTPDELAAQGSEAPYLKVHGTQGELTVLEQWELDPAERRITGNGQRFDAERTKVASGPLEVGYDDVALLETNAPKTVVHSGLVVMGVVSAGVLTGTIACAVNPKACFGSCPTFYRPGQDDEPSQILAEGFSASIARSLEATDVDALGDWQHDGGPLQLLMRNEALETHVVRHVEVLAVPQPDGAEVLRDGDEFWASGRSHAPSACDSDGGDCRLALRAQDDQAFQSRASPRDLAARETIRLRLPRGEGPVGVVLRARNTLLNTFLFYQALAFFGPRAGEQLSALDRAEPDDPAVQRLRRFGELMADIEIAVRTRGGRWVSIGSYREIGPLAWETKVVPVPEALLARLPDDVVDVRLRLTQGYWKLDRVALAELDHPLVPVRLAPTAAWRDDDREPDADALARLLDPESTLVTYPGDRVRLGYDAPEGPHVLFLDSRGYYYEWMRSEWLFDFDPAAGRELLGTPRRALRRLAPYYARVEAGAEEVFWNSQVR
ncbi:MAG: hypothetical protein AB1Z98_15035 [Nannocystaceae bacterium]